MLCVVINGPSYTLANQQIANAAKYANLLELRLDNFQTINLVELKKLRASTSLPMIFTLRSALQGGNYKESEDNRLADIRLLASLKPEYFDLENCIPSYFIKEIAMRFPETKLILSYHNFNETPQDLDGLLHEMQKTPAVFYKIAVTASNSLDALRLLCLAKKSEKLIAIGMGAHGQITRILGPIIGNPITYAALDDSQISAPGQLSAKTLIENYHFHDLSPKTAVYGLIGDPVDKSISDQTHNHLMRSCGLAAVYVKMQVKPPELPDFLQLAKSLPFCGLSVTMPLKEAVKPHLDHIAPQALEIGAVNTLLFRDGGIIGFNTDGIGALNAIETDMLVRGKKIVMIGAGGAAKAIAFEAHRRGGDITIINRDVDKAKLIANSVQGVAKRLDQMAECTEEGYDILINCTPLDMPIAEEHIIPHTTVMEIRTKPKETSFVTCALTKNCPVVYGYQMFAEQALGQFSLWFNDRIQTQDCRTILETKARECLAG